MLFVLILEHVTCSRWTVLKLRCRFRNHGLCISAQIDTCKLCRASIDKDGSWNRFWFIPQTAIQNSSDWRAICACIFFLFFFPFSLFHLSLPLIAMLFLLLMSSWNCIGTNLSLFFPSHTLWRVVMREMLRA